MYEIILSEFKKMGLINNFFNNEKDFLDYINNIYFLDYIYKPKIVYYNNLDIIYLGDDYFGFFNNFSNTIQNINHKKILIKEYKYFEKKKEINDKIKELYIHNINNIYYKQNYNIIDKFYYSDYELELSNDILKENKKINIEEYYCKFIKLYNLYSIYYVLKKKEYISFDNYIENHFSNKDSLAYKLNKIILHFNLPDYNSGTLYNCSEELDGMLYDTVLTNINTCIRNVRIDYKPIYSGYLITQKNKDNLELLILSFYFDLFENGFNFLIFEESNIIIDEICHNLNTGKLYNIAIDFSKPYQEINNKFNQYLEKIKEENSLAKMLLKK